MHRTPLHELCLQIKLLELGEIEDFLAKARAPTPTTATTTMGHTYYGHTYYGPHLLRPHLLWATPSRATLTMAMPTRATLTTGHTY